MKLAFRYYGPDYDTINLNHIKQIPNIDGVITTIFDKGCEEIWSKEEILSLKNYINKHNLEILGIESLNVSEDIKAGLNNRDEHIHNYIESLKNLAQCGIKMVCYNFMPLFDWTRTNLNKLNDDGSYSLAFDQKDINNIDPLKMFEKMSLETNSLPGWDKHKENKIKDLFEIYKSMNSDQLFNNLKYFLDAIMPICDQYDIDLAIHPDDPAWPIMNIPRIVTNKENIMKIMKLNDNKHNGITLCTGSLASNKENDLVDIIYSLKDRINFVHIRNIKLIDDHHFIETAHPSDYGDIDVYKVIKALVDIDYQGVIRPDHGRMIWDEKAMPGYGLYDRALGLSYINGLLEAITKGKIHEN